MSDNKEELSNSEVTETGTPKLDYSKEYWRLTGRYELVCQTNQIQSNMLGEAQRKIAALEQKVVELNTKNKNYRTFLDNQNKAIERFKNGY